MKAFFTPVPLFKLIYNAQGQLSELRDASNVLIAKYVYRGDGKRPRKELANGTRSYFYYAGEQMIAATNGNDVSSLVLWGADGIVGSRVVNSTTNTVTKLYNLYDTQGNLAQTIDASGAVISQNAVSAWGEPIRDGAGNVSGGGYGAKFGYLYDGESGFYLCTLRYYDPSAGRWLTRDPIGYAGGSNLYGYVGNDPVNAVDPSGLAPAPGDKSYGPPINANQLNMPDGHLVFDGIMLKWFKPNGTIRTQVPAYSGSPGTKAADQVSVIGPLPEGEYIINPRDVTANTTNPIADKLPGVAMYNADDWGQKWANIQPVGPTASKVRNFGRNPKKFFLHGGKWIGSHGCIDIGSQDERILNAIYNSSGPVRLTVRYANPNAAVPGSLKPSIRIPWP